MASDFLEFVSELHVHSKYAGACSDKLTLENIDATAKTKGIGIIGTGDFAHPEWFKQMKSLLVPHGNGLFGVKGSESGVNFVVSGEICTIFPKNKQGKAGMFDRTGNVAKIHHCILLPDLESAEQISEMLAKYGSLSIDGRPQLSMSASELVEIVMGVNSKAFVFPAHCLLPSEIVITNPEIKEIQNIREGEKVFTHTGNTRLVKKVLSRKYTGKVFKVIPWYFSGGVETTPEHPFLAIKTIKKCSGTGDICKPTKSHIRNCYNHRYKNYKPVWVAAENLEIGDVLLYPRLSRNIDVKILRMKDYINPVGSFPEKIMADAKFCRLAGYYLAEGYSNKRDGIGFSFNSKTEREYVEEVKSLVKEVFKIDAKSGKTDGDIVVYSKNIMRLFELLFYAGPIKNAMTKCLPQWALYLPIKKQVELFKCWWRGDKGYTVSRLLHNQLKLICLRLGIIPSTYVNKRIHHQKRGKHFIGQREIKANSDMYTFTHLAFFNDFLGLLKEMEFKNFATKTDKRHGWIDERFVYIPVRKITTKNYTGQVFNLEVEKDNSFLTESASVHNCWTPWFGALGSMGGFDSIEEVYEDQVKCIRALESGLSADPAMIWRVSKLDKYTIISGGDAHSLPKLGREATVLEMEEKELSYEAIISAIKEKRIKCTIEFYPEEGKYHFDGHRKCNVSFSPEEAAKYNNICPVCRKKLTLGVLNRVSKLADREPGYVLKGAPPFVHAIPLDEIIAFVSKKGVQTVYVREMYEKLIKKFGTELNVLLHANADSIAEVDKQLSAAIENVRADRVSIKPGYDGVFGIIDILSEAGKSAGAARPFGQKTIGAF